MLNQETIRRLRDMQAHWAHAAAYTTVAIQAYGRADGLTATEFAELLDAAELGMHILGAAKIVLPTEQVRYQILQEAEIDRS